MPATDLPAALVGRWAVERDLRDLRAGQEGRFTGTATITPDAEGLAWTEEGTLRLGGHEGPARRGYLVRHEHGGWVVRFEDGRFFHPLDVAGAPVEHPCGEDLYTGAVRLEGDELQITWRVRGPRKDQHISGRYRRLED